MSRLFTKIKPGQGASNARQRGDLENAAKLKSKILETGKRLCRLDGKRADLTEKDDVVPIGGETKLPKTLGHSAQVIAFGVLANLGHVEKKATVDSAYSTQENGELKNMTKGTVSSSQFASSKSSVDEPVVGVPAEKNSNTNSAAEPQFQIRLDTNAWKPVAPGGLSMGRPLLQKRP